MYRKKDPQIHMNEYIKPFSGTLNPNNRWVQMAELIPWDEFEDEYASNCGDTGNASHVLLCECILQYEENSDRTCGRWLFKIVRVLRSLERLAVSMENKRLFEEILNIRWFLLCVYHTIYNENQFMLFR